MIRFLRRRAEETALPAPVAPAGPVEPGPAAAAGLPAPLRRAVGRELAPGEQVEVVLQPGGARPDALGKKLAVWGGAVGGIGLLGLASGFWSLPALAFWLALGAYAILADWYRSRKSAYVVTDRRAFRLRLAGQRARARPLRLPAECQDLEPRDRAALRERLRLLIVRANGGKPDGGSAVAETAAARAAEAAEAVAALPAPVRAALRQELCPGEEVVCVAQPAGAAPEWLALQVGGWGLGLWGLFLLGVAPPLYYPLALGTTAAGLWAWWETRRRSAYVGTNQRCFHLGRAGVGVNVHELGQPQLVGLAGLEPEDRAELQAHCLALESRIPGGRGKEERRVERRLPERLRRRVESALMPDETLLWADRPTASQYFAQAPLDVPTILLYIIAAFAPFGGLIYGGVAQAAVGWLPVAATAVGAAGLASLRLWHQVRSTVYAVTDRRGMVISPGQITAYTPAEMYRFQRVQAPGGRGDLRAGNLSGVGFYGVTDVKAVDDLIKGRAIRQHSTELAPAEAPAGRGDEPAPTG